MKDSSDSNEALEGTRIVVGPPGCGKTSYLAKQVARIVVEFSERSDLGRWSSPVLVCSLTRAAAVEAAGRVVQTGAIPRESVGTLHSFCYRAIGKRRVVDQGDLRQWQGMRLPVEEFPLPRKKLSDAAFDRDRLNSSLDQDRERKAAAAWLRYERARHRLEGPPRGMEEFHLAWTEFKAARGVVDFTDMIEVARRSVPIAPGNPWVILADEAQDLTPLELDVLRLWGQRAGCLMLIGDPMQSIYYWRGALPNFSVETGVSSSRRLILSQSYRVPGAVRKFARHWVATQTPGVGQPEYRPREIFGEPYEGWVRSSSSTWKHPEAMVKWAAEKVTEDPNDTVMFIASCEHLLSPTISIMRKIGLPFSNPWRRANGKWNPLKQERGRSTAWRLRRLLSACKDSEPREEWTSAGVAEFVKILKAEGVLLHGAKKRISHLEQDEGPGREVSKYDLDSWFCPGTLIWKAWAGELSEREMLDWWLEHRVGTINGHQAMYLYRVARRFGSMALVEEPRCYVGTIHSLKGSEADFCVVYPEISKAAYNEWRIYGEGFEEIVRAFYVAFTRSREGLFVCNPEMRSSVRGLCVPLMRTMRAYLDFESECDVSVS